MRSFLWDLSLTWVQLIHINAVQVECTAHTYLIMRTIPSPLTCSACSLLSHEAVLFLDLWSSPILRMFSIGGDVKWRGKMEVHSNNRFNLNPSEYLLGGMFVLHIGQ